MKLVGWARLHANRGLQITRMLGGLREVRGFCSMRRKKSRHGLKKFVWLPFADEAVDVRGDVAGQGPKVREHDNRRSGIDESDLAGEVNRGLEGVESVIEQDQANTFCAGYFGA